MTAWRALTVRQPYASAFFIPTAPKLVENRTWKTEYRGPLAIIAGKQIDSSPEAEAAWFAIAGRKAPTGRIVGVVELMSIHEQFSGACNCTLETRGGWARCTPLAAERPMQHWMLGNPRGLADDQVFPYTGQLGLATMGADITRALKEALA